MRFPCAVALCGLILFAVVPAHGQQILWQFTNEVTEATFARAPAVGDDGTIYIGSAGGFGNANKLYAVGPTGVKRWEFGTEIPVNTPATIGDDGTIYIGTRSPGKVIALNPDGTLKWDYNTGSVQVRDLALGHDGTIYCRASFSFSSPRTNFTKLYAINAEGSKKWEFRVSEELSGGSIMVNFDDTIFFGAGENSFVVNPDGTLYWSFPVGSGYRGAIGGDGTLYVSGYESGEGQVRLYALNPDGTADWTFTAGDQPIVGVDGTIYVDLYALSPQGLKLWESNNGLRSSPRLASADGTLYGVDDGKLFALGPNGGLKWRLPLQTASFDGLPALLPDGTLYVNSQTRLFAIKVPCGLANSSWPMEGRDVKRTSRAGLGMPVRPCLSALRLAGNRGFQFTLVGEIGSSYEVQTSGDLVGWAPLTNFVCSSLVTHFTDAMATNLSKRFYRAVSR